MKLINKAMDDSDFLQQYFPEKNKIFRNIELNVLYKIQVKRLNLWSGIAYSEKCSLYEEMLMRLWTNLKPESKLRGRKTEQWIDIGFQGKDPATDFRGAGVLGLE